MSLLPGRAGRGDAGDEDIAVRVDRDARCDLVEVYEIEIEVERDAAVAD